MIIIGIYRRFRESNARVAQNEWYPFKYYEGGSRSLGDFGTIPALQQVKMNAGYTDGSVVKFNSADTIKVGMYNGWASYRFPTNWH